MLIIGKNDQAMTLIVTLTELEWTTLQEAAGTEQKSSTVGTTLACEKIKETVDALQLLHTIRADLKKSLDLFKILASRIDAVSGNHKV